MGVSALVPVREVVLEGDMRSPLALQRIASRRTLRRTLAVISLVCIDLVSLLLAAWAASAVQSIDGRFVLVMSLATPALASVAGLYGRRWRRRRPARIAASMLALLAFGSACLAVGGGAGGWPLFLAFWALWGAIDIGSRLAYDAAVGKALGHQDDVEGVVVIGDPARAGALVSALDGHGMHVRFRLQAALPLAATQDLEDLLPAADVSYLVVSGDAVHSPQITRMLDLARAHGLSVLLAGDGLGDDAVCVLSGNARPIFAVKPAYSRRRLYPIKRAFDIAAAGVLLAVLSPFLLAIAAVIRLSTPGPAIYVSWRMGACLRSFPCLKFRTMSADAEGRQAELEERNEASGCLFKIREDPRVTTVGRFLRRTSVDELPQLINVLAGHMSLVGPRPLPLRDVELMDDRQQRRHAVLPGLTGLWQISGRSDASADQMIAFDLRYIESWSLRQDVAILFRTLPVVAGSHGAY
jgi:exopolysaccharide biosynthesis polyprenyl glycosylphosphotransferase